MIRSLFRLLESLGDAGKTARGNVVALFITAALGAVCEGLAFIALIPLFTRVRAGEGVGQLMVLLLCLLGGFVVFHTVSGQIGRRASTGILAALIRIFEGRLRTLPVGYFGPTVTGRFIELAESGISFSGAVASTVIRPVVGAIVTPLVLVCGLLYFMPLVAVVCICGLPLLYWAYRAVARAGNVSSKEFEAASAMTSTRLTEFVRAQAAIRAAEVRESGDGSIADEVMDNALCAQHQAFGNATVTQGTAIGRMTTLAQAVMVAGVIAAAVTDVQSAQFLALTVVLTRMIDPIIGAGTLQGGFGQAASTLEQLEELAAVPALTEPDDGAAADIARCADGSSIALQHVDFGYGEKQILHDISFTAEPGTVTAIVGPSGCGKTTVLKLLARFVDPWDGEVTLNGVSYPRCGSGEVRKHVGAVFQDTYLPGAKLADALRIADPQASEAECRTALHQAMLGDELRLEQNIGEGGAALSGGERQRVCIARALLADRTVILFDEPTASLDSYAERGVMNLIADLRAGGKTIIMVANKLSTVVRADQIVVLDGQGRIADCGRHDELMVRCQSYRRGVEKEQQTSNWRLV